MNSTKLRIIAQARGSAEMLVGAAKAVPADKLEWSPGGEASTVLWQMRHCASFPFWVMDVVDAGKFVPTAGQGPEVKLFEDSITDLDTAIAKLRESTEKFAKYVEAVPDEKLDMELEFPWAKSTVAGALGYQEWNNTYHYGQINYIQFLLGDKEMH